MDRPTLPEIEDFNGLGDVRRFRFFASCSIERVFEATWQRCRGHWMRPALAHVSRGWHSVAAAALRQAFDQPDRASATETWCKVADRLRPRWPKLAEPMGTGEHDVLVYITFPKQHRKKQHSTNPSRA